MIRLDEGSETVVGPGRFAAEGLTAAAHFRVFHDDLYLEVTTHEPEIDRREAIATILLYSVGPDGSLAKVLAEQAQTLTGRCGLHDQIQLKSDGKDATTLRLVVARRKVGDGPSPRSEACAALRPGARSQAYRLHDGCYRPQEGPFYFASDLARASAPAPNCATSVCETEVPRSPVAHSLLDRLKGAAFTVRVPASWDRIGTSTTFELAPGCRAAFSLSGLSPMSRYIRINGPDEVDRAARTWISECCRHSDRCLAIYPPSQPAYQGQSRCLESVEAISEWRACRDLQRLHAADDLRRLDVIAARVAQADGSSAVLLATLACDAHRYTSAATELEAVLENIELETGTSPRP